jgi:hypothetical protein
MTIQITETSFTGFKIEVLWPAGSGLHAVLTLTDPDGQVQVDEINWMATEEMSVETVVQTLAASIEALPHWRARELLGQLRYGTASADYSGTMTLEVV